jgi:hypothetical protein
LLTLKYLSISGKSQNVEASLIDIKPSSASTHLYYLIEFLKNLPESSDSREAYYTPESCFYKKIKDDFVNYFAKPAFYH